MKRIAVGYGKNAISIYSGGVQDTSRRSVASGAVLMPGANIPPQPVPVPAAKQDETRSGLCAGNDDTCKARKAKGTDWCAGHLRARGEL
jgi:hypothetical protein